MSQTGILITGIADQPQSACFNVEDRWRVYGDRDDFKRGMASLDQLALVKSLAAMREDLTL